MVEGSILAIAFKSNFFHPSLSTTFHSFSSFTFIFFSSFPSFYHPFLLSIMMNYQQGCFVFITVVPIILKFVWEKLFLKFSLILLISMMQFIVSTTTNFIIKHVFSNSANFTWWLEFFEWNSLVTEVSLPYDSFGWEVKKRLPNIIHC